MKCDCKVFDNDHGEWCSSHPVNLVKEAANAIRQRITQLEADNAKLAESMKHWIGIAEEQRHSKTILSIENLRMREALINIAKANYAGPSTDERREWTWATTQKCLDDSAHTAHLSRVREAEAMVIEEAKDYMKLGRITSHSKLHAALIHLERVRKEGE